MTRKISWTLPLIAIATASLAASGLQVTPDAKRALVSKDVGAQRWAITCDEDGTITGNVYSQDGDVAFVWCDLAGDDGNPDERQRIYDLDCFGADACVKAPCVPEQWSFIAAVQLPGSFCLPPLPVGTPVPSPSALATSTPRPTPTPTATSIPTPTVVRTPARTPTPRLTASPSPRPTRAPSCCKVCSTGKACGDSCISRSDSCSKGPGCACNG